MEKHKKVKILLQFFNIVCRHLWMSSLCTGFFQCKYRVKNVIPIILIDFLTILKMNSPSIDSRRVLDCCWFLLYWAMLLLRRFPKASAQWASLLAAYWTAKIWVGEISWARCWRGCSDIWGYSVRKPAQQHNSMWRNKQRQCGSAETRLNLGFSRYSKLGMLHRYNCVNSYQRSIISKHRSFNTFWFNLLIAKCLFLKVDKPQDERKKNVYVNWIVVIPFPCCCNSIWPFIWHGDYKDLASVTEDLWSHHLTACRGMQNKRPDKGVAFSHLDPVPVLR